MRVKLVDVQNRTITFYDLEPVEDLHAQPSSSIWAGNVGETKTFKSIEEMNAWINGLHGFRPVVNGIPMSDINEGHCL